MLRNLKYKTRLKLLGIGIPIFGLVCYYTAIEKTITLWQENKFLNAQLEDSKTVEMQIQQYQEKTKLLDNIYALTGTGSRHEAILKNASDFCQKNAILIRDFPAPKIFEEPSYQIESTQFLVDGAFVDVLNLVYHIENKWKLGRVASLSFETVLDRQTRTRRLQTKIFIQNIKPRNDEK